MIEAIKSTLSVAPVVQKAVAQTSTATSYAVESDSSAVSSASTEGFYVSRNVRVDNTAKVAVLEFRNPLNGDVKTQIPTEAQLEAYERAEFLEKQDSQTLV